MIETWNLGFYVIFTVWGVLWYLIARRERVGRNAAHVETRRQIERAHELSLNIIDLHEHIDQTQRFLTEARADARLRDSLLVAIRDNMGLGPSTEFRQLPIEVFGYVQGSAAESARVDELQAEVSALRRETSPDAALTARLYAENTALRTRNLTFMAEIRRLQAGDTDFNALLSEPPRSPEPDYTFLNKLLNDIEASKRSVASTRNGHEEIRSTGVDRISMLMDTGADELG